MSSESGSNDLGERFERVPFADEARLKVRSRLRAFGVGIAFVVLLAAGFDISIIFAGMLSTLAKLLMCLFFVLLGLLLIGLIGYRARQQVRDLRLGYALRYVGPVRLALHENKGSESAPEFHIVLPGRLLKTSRLPFLKIGRREDFVDVLLYEATVEFTPLAGDVLVRKTREFGDVRA